MSCVLCRPDPIPRIRKCAINEGIERHADEARLLKRVPSDCKADFAAVRVVASLEIDERLMFDVHQEILETSFDSGVVHGSS